MSTALYVLVMISTVVAVAVLFLRHHLWVRLAVNVGIVATLPLLYVRFLRSP